MDILKHRIFADADLSGNFARGQIFLLAVICVLVFHLALLALTGLFDSAVLCKVGLNIAVDQIELLVSGGWHLDRRRRDSPPTI